MPHSRGFERRRDDRSKDPVPIWSVVDALMAEDLLARGRPLAQLVSAWPSIVGERLARECAPIALEDGVLSLGVSNGPWGAQVKFLHEEIRRKADEAVGGVRAIRVLVRPR